MRRLLPLLLTAPLLLGLAGCGGNVADPSTGGATSVPVNNTSVDSYLAPGGLAPAAPAPPAPPAPTPPAIPAEAPPPPAGRPMTPFEAQYRQACQSDLVHNGCELYANDYALRLQGIDPGNT